MTERSPVCEHCGLSVIPCAPCCRHSGWLHRESGLHECADERRKAWPLSHAGKITEEKR